MSELELLTMIRSKFDFIDKEQVLIMAVEAGKVIATNNAIKMDEQNAKKVRDSLRPKSNG